MKSATRISVIIFVQMVGHHWPMTCKALSIAISCHCASHFPLVWHSNVVNDLPHLQLHLSSYSQKSSLFVFALAGSHLLQKVFASLTSCFEIHSMSKLSNLLFISLFLAVFPRDILVPSPTNGGPCRGFTSTCGSIPAVLPEIWYFCLMSCMSLSSSFNVLQYSSRFVSPHHVCAKYLDRNRILSRTTSTHLVLLRECLKKTHVFLFDSNRCLSFFFSLSNVHPVSSAVPSFCQFLGLLKHHYIGLTLSHVTQEVILC